ncbi:MAG: DUF6512 family protein [Acutalibacteraceae bacterium]
MKEKNWNRFGAFFTAVVGSLLHFLYEWFPSGFTAVWGAVNESTWEHMKLAFWPMLFFAAVEYLLYGKQTKGFLPIRVCSILIAVLLIPILFYSYTGVFGKSVVILDILIFYGAVAAAYTFSCKQLQNPWHRFRTLWAELLSCAVLLVMLVCFLSFTKKAPHLPLFCDPISGTYGIAQQTLLRT